MTFVSFIRAASPLLVCWAGAGCIFMGTVLPPANRPARGPATMSQQTRYDSTYNAYKFQEGYGMEAARQFDASLWSSLGGLRLGIIYGSVTMPILATGQPTGPLVVERSATCVLWVCWDEDPGLRYRNVRLGTVATVDARVTSVLFGLYSRRTLIFRGSSVAAPPAPAQVPPTGPEIESDPAQPVEQPPPSAEPDPTPPKPLEKPAETPGQPPAPDTPAKPPALAPASEKPADPAAKPPAASAPSKPAEG